MPLIVKYGINLINFKEFSIKLISSKIHPPCRDTIGRKECDQIIRNEAKLGNNDGFVQLIEQ